MSILNAAHFPIMVKWGYIFRINIFYFLKKPITWLARPLKYNSISVIVAANTLFFNVYHVYLYKYYIKFFIISQNRDATMSNEDGSSCHPHSYIKPLSFNSLSSVGLLISSSSAISFLFIFLFWYCS